MAEVSLRSVSGRIALSLCDVTDITLYIVLSRGAIKFHSVQPTHDIKVAEMSLWRDNYVFFGDKCLLKLIIGCLKRTRVHGRVI